MTYPNHSPYPVAPPKKRSNLFIGGCGAIVFALLLFGGCAVVAVVSSSPSIKATPPIQVTATDSSPATSHEASVPAPKAKAKPVVVLREAGSGMKSTASFKVHGDWDLTYTYHCPSGDSVGYFGVSGSSGLGDVYVNETGTKGGDTTHQHDGPGKMSLSINSTCPWTIKVIQLPG